MPVRRLPMCGVVPGPRKTVKNPPYRRKELEHWLRLLEANKAPRSEK